VTVRQSALYIGTVGHRRLRPRKHALRYRLFSLLIDLDELPELAGGFRLFSRNRFNLFSFYDADHGASSDEPLKQQVEAVMRQGGVEPDGGAICLLTLPRILGYAFNPLSVYFCYARDNALRAILYEVSNTFGERHSYFIPVAADAVAPIRQMCDKGFYVSPFLAMDMRYEFIVSPPDETLSIAIIETDRDGVILTANQNQRRVSLSDAAMLRVFVAHPLLTLKVIVGIHFEALRLWAKGVRLYAHPQPPARPVTFVALSPGGLDDVAA
jgi:DUF1365 family protein